MNILALDTSTNSGSIAICKDGVLLSESVLNTDATHSETLLPVLRNMLSEAGIAMNGIDLLALTTGPGSFTGIRIGVSTIKGFAYAGGMPVAGVSSLKALAMNFPFASFQITPVMDARRGEVYSASFRWEGGSLRRLSEDRAIRPEKLIEGISEKTIFAGDGLNRYGSMFNEHLKGMFVAAPSEYNFIRSSAVAWLGLEKYNKGETLDLFNFTPVYLRKSEAEIKREKGLL